jgi:hypothetical protein
MPLRRAEIVRRYNVAFARALASDTGEGKIAIP